MWRLNVNRWIRCFVDKFTKATAPLAPRRFLSWRRYSLLTFTGFSLCSAVTTPRQLRGWTPAWRRRQSPLRSARMVVCRHPHASTRGHTSVVRAPHYTIQHLIPFHAINQITKQDKIWVLNSFLKWQITSEQLLASQSRGLIFQKPRVYLKECQMYLCIPRMIMWA